MEGIAQAPGDIMSLLHKSILDGENYQFDNIEDAQSFFDNAISKVSSYKNLTIPSNFQEDLLDVANEILTTAFTRFNKLAAFLKVYFELIKLTYDELEDFGKDNKSLRHYRISRIIDIDHPEELLLNANPQQFSNDSVDREIYFLKLNLIAAELDFFLNCDNQYISDLIDVFRVIEYRNHELKDKVTPADRENYMILESKCLLLLKKALARRSDLKHSITYISLITHAPNTLSYDTISTIHFDFFNEQTDSNYSPKFDPNDNLTFKKKKNEFDHHFKEQKIDFSSVHYMCKYYRKASLPIDEKVSSLRSLHEKLKTITPGSSNLSLFDKPAYVSLLSLVHKTVLRVTVDEVIKHCGLGDISEAAKWFEQAEKKYSEINTDYESCGIIIKDFYHHKIYLQAAIQLGELYIKSIEKFQSNGGGAPHIDVMKCVEQVDSLSKLANSCIQQLPIYRDNLLWCKAHNFIPIYLPFFQCQKVTILGEEQEQTYTKISFLDSSYIRPVNYGHERNQLISDQFKVEFIITKLVELSKYANDQRLKLTENRLVNDLKTVSREQYEDFQKNIKSTEKQINDQISTNNIKSVQYLGIFSAMIALSVAALQGFQHTTSLDGFILAMTGIGTLLIAFVSLLSVITLQLDKGENLIKLVLLFIITISLTILSIYYYKSVYSDTKEVAKNSVEPSTELIF